MVKSYAGLTSLTETLVTKTDQANTARTVTAQLALKRPGFASYHSDSPAVTEVADGTYFYEVSNGHPGQYLQYRIPKDESAFATAASNGLQLEYDLDMFGNTGDLKGVIDELRTASMTVGKPITQAGVALDTVALTWRSSTGLTVMTLRIGHQDHLLREVDLKEQPSHKNPRASPLTGTETFENVKANAVIPESVFTFTPPAGLKPHHASSFSAPEDSHDE
jgi:hypothetical protein